MTAADAGPYKVPAKGALTGLILKVTPDGCIFGATTRDFHAWTNVLKGWVALPVDTAPV